MFVRSLKKKALKERLLDFFFFLKIRLEKYVALVNGKASFKKCRKNTGVKLSFM